MVATENKARRNKKHRQVSEEQSCNISSKLFNEANIENPEEMITKKRNKKRQKEPSETGQNEFENLKESIDTNITSAELEEIKQNKPRNEMKKKKSICSDTGLSDLSYNHHKYDCNSSTEIEKNENDISQNKDPEEQRMKQSKKCLQSNLPEECKSNELGENMEESNIKVKHKKKKLKKEHKIKEKSLENVTNGSEKLFELEDKTKKKKKKRKYRDQEINDSVKKVKCKDTPDEQTKSENSKNDILNAYDDLKKRKKHKKKYLDKNPPIDAESVESEEIKENEEEKEIKQKKKKKKRKQTEEDPNESTSSKKRKSELSVKKENEILDELDEDKSIKMKNSKKNHKKSKDILDAAEDDTFTEVKKLKKKSKKKTRKEKDDTNFERKCDITIEKREETKHIEETDVKHKESQENGCDSSSSSQTVTALTTGVGQWGSADLGDSNRQNKFLRLMGASKKNTLCSGDTPQQRPLFNSKFRTALTSKEETKLADALEKQYTQALTFSLSRKDHKTGGLGFEFPPEQNKKFYIDRSKNKSVKFNE